MEELNQAIQSISACLLATLDPKTQKQAEAQLVSFETTVQNFPGILLSLTSPETIKAHNLPQNIDIPAVILLKNIIKKFWANLDSPVLSVVSRNSIKRDIFSCMKIPNLNVRNQLSEIICIISQYDFPENWPELIDLVLSKIDKYDFASNLTVLKTCHKIFKKYRLEERSDDLYREINFVMEKFGPFLLDYFVLLESILKSDVSDPNKLSLITQNATFANKIFYSLSFQDIPAFFEDNLLKIMQILMYFFNFQSPYLVTHDDDQPGVSEKFASSVAKIVVLYSSKYEEDFTMLGDFAQASWHVLTNRTSLSAKDDKLTCTCIGFLASVSRQERHKSIFQNSMNIICDKIIIPNMKIRESDLEIFEDEPMEFIKRDAEGGSEVSNRHGSAVSLIHGLMEFHEQYMTEILFATVQSCLLNYTSDPGKNWSQKLLATQVFSAIGAKGFAESLGVTMVNPRLNIIDFFKSQILPDLMSSEKSLHPLLLLESIKFVVSYRNQLPKDVLSQCLPLMLHHLESGSFIIHTFAAIAVEKLLSVKINGEDLFAASDISAVVGRLSIGILALIFNQRTVEKMCENQFLIKAFVRVLALAQNNDIEGITQKFADRIIWLLTEIVMNPINPHFTHYFFEALVLMICGASVSPGTFSGLEAKIIPQIFVILQSEQTDLFPYAFQLLAVIVEFNPRQEFPDYVVSILPAVLQPTLWSVSSNIPSLVRFLQACFIKNPSVFYNPSSIEALISIFKILVNSKSNDIYGFNLISSLFGILTPDLVEKYLRPVLILILTRVQSNKTQKLSMYFLLFICYLCVEIKMPHSSRFVIHSLEQIQSKIYLMLFKSLFIPVISRIQEPSDKKLVIYGVIELLLELRELISGPEDLQSVWFSVLNELLKLSAVKGLTAAQLSEELSATPMSFNKLSSVPKFKKYYRLPELPESNLRLAQFIKSFDSAPGFQAQLHARLDSQAKILLGSLI